MTLRSKSWIRARRTALACVAALACAANAQDIPGQVPDQMQLLLPAPAAVQQALAQLPQVRAAEAGRAAAQAQGDRLRAGPHDWVAKASGNRRREQAGGRYVESEIGLERGLRWPGKAATDRALGTATERLAVLTQADAWHEAARTLLADWFEALREARSAQLLKAQEELMARTLAATQRRVDTGDAAPLELLATQAEHARVLALARRADSQATLRRQTLLRRYPGLPDPAQWWAYPASKGPAETAVAAPAADVVPDIADIQAWATRILDDNHELELAEAQAAQARLQAQRTQQERMPDPTVGIRATRERGGQEQVLGVYLSLPLGGTGREADARAAVAQAEVAQQELERTRQRVEADAWRVVGEAAQARAVLVQLQKALALIEKSAALQARAHALGESGLGDWLLAQRNALEARLAADTAALDAHQAQARVWLDAHRMWTQPHSHADH